MAVLNPNQLATLRRIMADRWPDGSPIDFPKATADACSQAMEDWYVSEKPEVKNLLDAASAPKVFTVPELKVISEAYLAWKYGWQEGG